MTRWRPDDIDVASVSERNRRAWAEQEAKRATQIGKYANGVPADSMSGGLRDRQEASSPGQERLTKDVGCNAPNQSGWPEPPPLTPQRAADAGPSGRARLDVAAQDQRSGPPASPQASPPVPAVSAAPVPCLVGKSTRRNKVGVSSGHSPAPNPPKEAAVLKLVLLALELHPRMAWHARMNSGAFVVGKRFIRAAFKGCADIIGQTTDGLFVAIEVKRPGGNPTEDQLAFLGRVGRNGGIAFVARGPGDVAKGLA